MKSKYKKENYISQNKGGYLNRIAFFHDVIADYIIGDDSARFTDTFVNNLDLTESGLIVQAPDLSDFHRIILGV